MRNKILAGFAGLLMAGTFAMTNVSAADSDTVTFTGATGSLSPAIGLNPGSGTFTFSSSTCAASDTDNGAQTCSISASGTYVNQVCGTGTADGTATVTSPKETESITFHIDFKGGQGTLTGTSGDGDAVTGYVNITPTGGDCVNGVTQFTASGQAVG